MRYSNFEIDDFINDEKFRSWVLSPTPEIKFFWEKWIMNNPSCEDKVLRARAILESLNLQATKISPERERVLQQRIEASLSHLAKEEPMQMTSHRTKLSPVRSPFYRKLAAACIILLLSATGLYFFQPDKNIDASTLTMKYNSAGRKSKVILPDGTKVNLNSESRLYFDKDNFKTNRQVRLEGEAFFDVEHDPSHPFVVISNKISTTALGTSFNVRAFGQKSHPEVALKTGKVLIANSESHASVILKPGEIARVNQDETLAVEQVNLDTYLLWTNGVIFYQDLALDEVLMQLERWYGVDISVRNRPAGTLRSSGNFDNEALSNVLTSMGFALGFEYKINDKNVIITFN